MEYLVWAFILYLLFLFGPPKLAEAKGKDEAWSNAKLGYELEFNEVPRNAAGV